jgi:cytochrome c oxidase subunit 3
MAKGGAVAHQFDTVAQQREAVTLGMWAFLVTEVLFFGAIFVSYAVYRAAHPHAFAEASRLLDVGLGAFNTAVLIASSLTMALAVRAAATDARRALVFFLGATAALGLVFLGVKAVEYGHKFHEHLVPGRTFDFGRFSGAEAGLFFSFYFVMTGMHALHMVIGVAVMAVLIGMALGGRFSSGYFSPVEMAGLYWHFVDIVWIFLFPLLYLIGRHL